MIRILFFLIPVFALALGFAWLAEQPGTMIVSFGGYEYRTGLAVAVAAVAALVALVMLVWWLIKSIVTSPARVSEHFRSRRRDKGYRALSAGMIAAGAGDPVLARRRKKEALRLLSADREPLVQLLDAQASLLEGDHAAARSKFQAMLEKPDMKLLGLRGLYLEAERVGDRGAARHYAEEAVVAAPQLNWASDAALSERTEAGDWDGALRLIDGQRGGNTAERERVARRKAVLLTARAMDVLDADPVQAKNAAMEAHRLAPDLVPAAVTAARALFRLDDLKRGAKLLEAAWKRDAHPEIADIYVHARSGDSTQDRLARAKKLQSIKQNNPESALAVARAALAAGDYALARKNAEAAIRQAPREGAYLVLADIEEAETGDQGRVRQWLAKALRAPRDPVWYADGQVSQTWMPVSPVTGRLDAFEWRAPAERLGQVIEPGDEALALPAFPGGDVDASHGSAQEPIEIDAEVPASPIDEKPVEAPIREPVVIVPAAPKETATGREEPNARAVDATVRPVGERTVPQAANDTRSAAARTSGPAVAPIAPATQSGDQPVAPESAAAKDARPTLAAAPAAGDEEAPLFPLPDDPGVPEDEKPQPQSRFRLF